MTDDRRQSGGDRDAAESPRTEPPRVLTEAAKRALAEAEERRRTHDRERAAPPRELGGQPGPEPTRYGDWEKGGIVSDF